MTETQIQLIKAEITRMDNRSVVAGRETLIRQIETEKRRIVPYQLNMPQAIFMSELEKPHVKEINLEGGRGLGKTTLEAMLIDKIIRHLPRSVTLLVASTYQKFLGDELPSLQLSLERLGYFEGLHYVIGRDFPASWNIPRAYQQPKAMEHCMKYWNGTINRIVSLDVSATARGLNADAQIKTEAATLNAEKLEANVSKAVRGTHDKAFAGRPYYGLDANLSSTPLTAEGRWFIDRELKYLEQQNAIAEAIKKGKIPPPQSLAYVKGTTMHNLHNLMHGYLQRERDKAVNMTIFNAECFNIRPPVVQDAFYAMLDEKRHAYTPERSEAYLTEGVFQDCRHDTDHDPNLPLIMGVDFGNRQNCATINQFFQNINEYRTLKDFFALGSDNEKQDDLAIKINKYYGIRQNKDIYMYYDHYGNIQWGHQVYTLAEQLRAKLEEFGWNVQLLTRGQSNPFHDLKYRLFQIIHGEEHYPEVPRYRINKVNARNTWVALTLAQTREGRNGAIGKNKTVERKTTIKEEYKTDITDANDAPMFDMFNHLLEGFGTSGAGSAYGIG